MATRVGPMQSFDLRDTIIPFSLLQIAHHFQQMKVGDEVEIFGNDPGIAQDLQSILPAPEATLRTIATAQDERPRFRWRLKKEMSSTKSNKGGASCQKSI